MRDRKLILLLILSEKLFTKYFRYFHNFIEQIDSYRSVPFTEIFRYCLQSLSFDADYLIDLHTSSDQGLNYLYYFGHRESSAKYFLFDFGILLDDYDGDAFDEAFIKPWLALEKALNYWGKQITFDVEAWSLELGCGMQILPDFVTKGVQGIKNYLIYKGVLVVDKAATRYQMLFKSKSDIAKYYAPTGGIIQARVPLGSIVKAGERLDQILSFNKTSELPTLIDIYAENDGLVYDVANQSSRESGRVCISDRVRVV